MYVNKMCLMAYDLQAFIHVLSDICLATPYSYECGIFFGFCKYNHRQANIDKKATIVMWILTICHISCNYSKTKTKKLYSLHVFFFYSLKYIPDAMTEFHFSILRILRHNLHVNSNVSNLMALTFCSIIYLYL